MSSDLFPRVCTVLFTTLPIPQLFRLQALYSSLLQEKDGLIHGRCCLKLWASSTVSAPLVLEMNPA